MSIDYEIFSDEELFARVIQDDELAFSELYNRYKRPLVAFTLSKIDSEYVEDIVHDLFSKLWYSRAELNIEKTFRSYIYQALRNRIIDAIDRLITERKYLDSLVLFQNEFFENADFSIREKQFLAHLNQLIQKYNPSEQTILKMRMEGYSNQEIAEHLGLNEKTVRNRYSLIIKDLRSKIKGLIIIFFF